MDTFKAESSDCGNLETSYFALKSETVLKFCGNAYIYKDNENLDSGRNVLNFICINSRCSAQLQCSLEKSSINLTTGHNMESCTSMHLEWSQSVPPLTKTKVKPETVEGPQSHQKVKVKTRKNSKRNSNCPIQTLQEGIVGISKQSLDTVRQDTSSSPSEIAATPVRQLRPIQPPLVHSITVILETPSLMTEKTGRRTSTPYPQH